MNGYAEGGYVEPPADGAEMVPIQLTRGCVLMTEASLRALGPDMLQRLFGDVDVVSAEEIIDSHEEEFGDE